MNFNTAVLHAGRGGIEKYGATLPPVYQSSAFEQESADGLAKIFENKAPGYCYTRVANPTVTAFENRITKLEGGIASVAFASGMAAITGAFLNILQSGSEIVTSASLYGGTIDLFRDLEALGIHTVFVENNNRAAFENAINEKTGLIFAETIGNPGLDVTDIKELSELAHAHGLPLIIDNTAATPYLVRPLELGADIVVNSSSKYINGNSSAISGILTDGGHICEALVRSGVGAFDLIDDDKVCLTNLNRQILATRKTVSGKQKEMRNTVFRMIMTGSNIISDTKRIHSGGIIEADKTAGLILIGRDRGEEFHGRYRILPADGGRRCFAERSCNRLFRE